MAELAFYPAVALVYFFGVQQANKDGRVDLTDRASVNVFCLFVLIQPLCLIIGGYTGMATYLISAYLSYSVLPWKQASEAEDKKKTTKKNK